MANQTLIESLTMLLIDRAITTCEMGEARLVGFDQFSASPLKRMEVRDTLKMHYETIISKTTETLEIKNTPVKITFRPDKVAFAITP